MKSTAVRKSAEFNVELPPKLSPLLQPMRYKVAYGGRGAAKSWGFARALLTRALQRRQRVLCAREIQRTIADSVHRLLSDQIGAMGFERYYNVQETLITNRYGSEFLFTGLRTQDVHKIKSFEGVDVVWCEEAQAITHRSWEILIPTIRKEDSEIWVSFNPDLDTDDTYQRFIVNPPEEAVVIPINWRDNPWFPAVLEKERQSLLRRDPLEYEYIWEGKPRSVVEGAIYAREIAALLEEGRVRNVPYNPKLLVHTIWDLGWNDQTSVIFVQRLHNECSIIDYEEESFLRYDEWAKILHAKQYIYGSHWLPHDGGNATQQGGGVSAQDQLKPLLHKRPKLAPRPESKEVPIKAARMLFPRIYMEKTKTVRLLDCLKHFRRHVPTHTEEPTTPVHDEYSHGADAFGVLAMVIDQLRNENEGPTLRAEVWEPADVGMGR